MKKYLFLIVLLIIISSCTLIKLKEEYFNKDIGDEVKNDQTTEDNRLSESEFGSIFSEDVEDYIIFQGRVACGENYDVLLIEYNYTTDRLVKIGKKISNGTLIKEVNGWLLSNCPERYEFVEPSIGTVED